MRLNDETFCWLVAWFIVYTREERDNHTRSRSVRLRFQNRKGWVKSIDRSATYEIRSLGIERVWQQYIYIYFSIFRPERCWKKGWKFSFIWRLNAASKSRQRDGSFASSQRVMPYSGNSPSLTSRVFDPRKLWPWHDTNEPTVAVYYIVSWRFARVDRMVPIHCDVAAQMP